MCGVWCGLRVLLGTGLVCSPVGGLDHCRVAQLELCGHVVPQAPNVIWFVWVCNDFYHFFGKCPPSSSGFEDERDEIWRVAVLVCFFFPQVAPRGRCGVLRLWFVLRCLIVGRLLRRRCCTTLPRRQPGCPSVPWRRVGFVGLRT